MQPTTLTETFAVSPQITAGDMVALRDAGFRSVLCNRPDGEAPDQPGFAEIAAAARAAGLAVAHVPVQPSGVEDGDVVAFGAALAKLPQPVLAYCRTGTRSAMLWSLHAAGRRPMAEILAATRAAGYDMSALAPRLARNAAAGQGLRGHRNAG